ncbi:MAG: hypothetical protein ABI573_06640 [Chloroflexota bacterium]
MPRQHLPPLIRAVSVATATIALLIVVAAPAAASGPPHHVVTRGDVVAAFEARTTGGYLNLLNGRTIAAPVRGLLDGRISSFTDRAYCSSDWHYLGVSLLGDGGHQSASTYLGMTSIDFLIDGVPVAPTMRTAVKPFVGTGLSGQFGMSVGSLVAPGSILAGDHTLVTHISTPDFGVETLIANFSLTQAACS